MIDADSVVIPISDDQMMAIKAERFIIQKYRLCGVGTFDRREVINGAVDIELMAKGKAERVLLDYISNYVKITGPNYSGSPLAEYVAEIDLPYIRTKAMEDLDRQIHALELHRNHLQSNAVWYRDEIRKLEAVITEQQRYIELPWYIKLGQWISRP